MGETAGPSLRIMASCVFRLAIRSITSLLPASDSLAIEIAPSHALAQRLVGGEFPDLALLGDIALLENLSLPGEPARPVATDRLMVAARPEIGLTERNLLDRLLDDRVRVITCEAGRHATGDLALRLFDRAEALRPGAAGQLRRKSRQTLLARNGTAAILGPRRVMDVLGSGEADVVLATRSALRTLSAVATLVAPGPELEVRLDCGMALLSPDPARRARAQHVADVVIAPEAQAVFVRHGFDAVWDCTPMDRHAGREAWGRADSAPVNKADVP